MLFFSCDSKIFISRPPVKLFSYAYRKWVGRSTGEPFTYKISFIVDVVRPDEDSQVREAAEVWRVEATEVDLYILLIGVFEERVCKK